MESMVPLLVVALLIWAGVFAFVFVVDRKVGALEKRMADRADRAGARREEDDR